MKKVVLMTLCFVTLGIYMVSCGSFGQGMASAFAHYPMGGYGYNNFGYSSYGGGGGSMDYLLDPSYAAAQVNAQQDAEYREFARYNKKPDGSTYTKNEWLEMKAEAYARSNSSSSSSSGSRSRSSSQTNSSYTNSSCPYCNNTGQIIIEQSVASMGNNNSRYCDICNKQTLSGYSHSHHNCKCGRSRKSGNIPTYNRIPW